MKSEWVQTTLGSIATEDGYGLVDGPFGSELPASCYTDRGIPVIRGSNLTVGKARFVSNKFVFVSPDTARRHERSLSRPLDIVFTKKGTLGQAGIIPVDGPYNLYLISSNQMKLTVNRRLADPLFIYYFASSAQSVARLLRESESTGVPKTNVKYLRDFPVTLPPLAEQQAISRLLGALDDKVDLNRRMNETLEAMARAIFKDWFVDFGPVRAKAEGRQPPGLASDMAALFPDALDNEDKPVGWLRRVLGDIAQNIVRSCQPNEIESGAPYIALEHMPRRSIALHDWSVADKVESNKLRFRRGEFLFGKLRPYFHKVGVAPVDGVCTTDAVVVSAKDPAWSAAVLMTLSSDEFVAFTDQGSTGTKMPRTNWGEMARYPIVCPPTPTLARALNDLVNPMTAHIAANITEARTLAALRDLLLPKLMSGEIRIQDAEKAVEPAA